MPTIESPRRPVRSSLALLPLALLWLAPAGRLAAQGEPPAFHERQLRREAERDAKLHAAIDNGLFWLKGQQSEDGRFSATTFPEPAVDGQAAPTLYATYDIGVTGLVLMAMLAQGDHEHDEACHRAADWLAKQMHPQTGRVEAAMHDFIYNQTIATLALCEAALLLGNQRHREASERAIRYLESHRNPGAAWRYQPRDNDNDASITAWCLACYAAARELDIEVPTRSIGQALAWLDSVTDFQTGATGYARLGDFSARRPGDHSERFPTDRTAAIPAAALHARLLSGLPPDDTLAQGAAATLAGKAPTWEAPAIDFYFWLHGSIAMALMPAGPNPKKWRQALQKALLPSQQKRGVTVGSWDPVGAWCEEGGRIYATAVAVIALSAEFRHAPVDPGAALPGPTFRKVQEALRGGKPGPAATALAAIDVAAQPAEVQAAARKVTFLVDVEVARAEQILASLDTRWQDTGRRLDRLDAITTALHGQPVANAAAERLEAIQKDPKFRAEAKAAKELPDLERTATEALTGSNKSRRKKVIDQLQKFIAKYPGTQSAGRAQDWIVRLQQAP